MWPATDQSVSLRGGLNMGVDAAVKVICREWASHGDQPFDWDDPTKSTEDERQVMRDDARRHLRAIDVALCGVLDRA